VLRSATLRSFLYLKVGSIRHVRARLSDQKMGSNFLIQKKIKNLIKFDNFFRFAIKVFSFLFNNKNENLKFWLKFNLKCLVKVNLIRSF